VSEKVNRRGVLGRIAILAGGAAGASLVATPENAVAYSHREAYGKCWLTWDQPEKVTKPDLDAALAEFVARHGCHPTLLQGDRSAVRQVFVALGKPPERASYERIWVTAGDVTVLVSANDMTPPNQLSLYCKRGRTYNR
jgi:hypothetical protein